MSDLLHTIRGLWQSACIDKPDRPSCQVKDGNFVFTITGNRSKWAELCQVSGVPAHADQQIIGDVLIVTWPSLADKLFAMDGPIAAIKPGYEVRVAQIHMARLIQRSIEMRDVGIIEAGTGTGKGFAYLAMCAAMNQSVVMSTSNKALQSQLMDVDIPALLKVFPGKKVALAQGKRNYACRMKAQDITAEGTWSPALAAWYDETKDGNLERIEFALTPRERNRIAVDDECPGRKACQYGMGTHEGDPSPCFYYKARDARDNADWIVTNHAMLALSMALPGGAILPYTSVIVVDEAHKLADYARNILGTELTDNQIQKALSICSAYGVGAEADRAAGRFNGDVSATIKMKLDEKQIGIQPDQLFDAGLALAEILHEAADDIYDPSVIGTAPDRYHMKNADRVRTVADKILTFSQTPVRGSTRWIELRDGMLVYFAAPYDVAPFLANLIGYTTEDHIVDHTVCARCGRKLTAPMVAVLDGVPYGPDCIRHVDVFGDAELVDLVDWIGVKVERVIVPARRHTTIFTSATLAVPDMALFEREVGVAGGLKMIVPSPFDYPEKCILYAPNAASPAPTAPEYGPWAMDETRRLVGASGGGALLLFTSYVAMDRCYKTLAAEFEANGWPVYLQGTKDAAGETLSKAEIVRRFSAHGNAVIMGTKSFFEGVSIPGDALRLVVVDKLPFQAPNPISTAIEAELTDYARSIGKTGRDAEFYPFNVARIPAMITDLLQAFGRLIRTGDDWGVVAILDTRLRSAQYGRNTVLPALPPARLTDNINVVRDWFFKHKPAPAPIALPTKKHRTIVPVEDFTIEVTA